MTMLCPKCNNEIKQNDKFCEVCGTKITAKLNNKQLELEKRIWFRALKVIYIFIIVLAVMIIGFFFWVGKPRKIVDYKNSYYQCNDDNKYVYYLDKNGIYLDYYTEQMGSSDDYTARRTCSKNETNKENETNSFLKYSIPTEKNYKLVIRYKYSDDFGSWIGYTLLSFLILYVIATLIKLSFFYIAIGEKPRIKMFKPW